MKNRMKNILMAAALALTSATAATAQDFNENFADSTLRIDYVFAGDASRQNIYVDELSRSPRWYGRRTRLAELPLKGNGSITVTDAATGDTLYRNSFSTLFQEWLTTAEAKRTPKSFENVFLVPFPKKKVNVSVELRDYHDRTRASLTHTVDPADILIRHIGERHLTPAVTLQKAADTTRCIHIAYVAEAYAPAAMDSFLNDARTATEALFAHEPFKSMRDRFNIVAVMSPSTDDAPSFPARHEWNQTALGSHFDTFYSDRYLTTLHLKRLHDVLAGQPYEHIIVLVNTDKYGGGGIYNSYNLTYTHGRFFKPVVVHEFGHSFGGLADEYEYGEGDPMYYADTEPWEPNLTTRHNFSDKWQNLIDAGKASLVEGGGYLQKGVWRGLPDCRMRTNENPEFCAVCRQALTRLIDFYTAPTANAGKPAVPVKKRK